jgi:hypothetical protein
VQTEVVAEVSKRHLLWGPLLARNASLLGRAKDEGHSSRLLLEASTVLSSSAAAAASDPWKFQRAHSAAIASRTSQLRVRPASIDAAFTHHPAPWVISSPVTPKAARHAYSATTAACGATGDSRPVALHSLAHTRVPLLSAAGSGQLLFSAFSLAAVEELVRRGGGTAHAARGGPKPQLAQRRGGEVGGRGKFRKEQGHPPVWSEVGTRHDVTALSAAEAGESCFSFLFLLLAPPPCFSSLLLLFASPPCFSSLLLLLASPLCFSFLLLPPPLLLLSFCVVGLLCEVSETNSCS